MNINKGSPTAAGQRVCIASSCGHKHYAKSFCRKHYIRQWRGTDPFEETKFDRRPAVISGDTARIPLGLGGNEYAVVDTGFSKLDVYNWFVGSTGYPTTNTTLNGKKTPVTMHSMILDRGKQEVIDHIDRDKMNNRLSNLRATSHRQNIINTSRVQNAKGYFMEASTGKYIVTALGKRYGKFDSEKEAIARLREVREELKSEYSLL